MFHICSCHLKIDIMAKLLISCDDDIFIYKGEYYYTDLSWCNFYNRYLRVFDSIRIAVRCTYVDTLKPQRVKVDDPRVEVVYIPNFIGPKGYAKQYFKIGKAIQHITDGCDAAIIRLPSTIGQRVARHVMNKQLPYGVEVVYDAEDGWRSETKWLNRFLWKRIDKEMRYTCYNADGVSCVTEHYLQKHYFSKKNNSFTANYSTLELPQSFYASSKEHPGSKTFVIANVANQIQFNGRKGFNEIIMAISILKKRGVMVDAKFVGQSYENGIEKLKVLSKELDVYDQIHYMGYLTRPELDQFLTTVDMYVMPTRAEGLPRVIIEAMAKGLPAISTPVSGNPELLPAHFLVKYEDVDTLADRIEELIKDKMVYEKASMDNFEKSKQYEASILEKRRDAFYQNLKACIK